MLLRRLLGRDHVYALLLVLLLHYLLLGHLMMHMLLLLGLLLQVLAHHHLGSQVLLLLLLPRKNVLGLRPLYVLRTLAVFVDVHEVLSLNHIWLGALGHEGVPARC